MDSIVRTVTFPGRYDSLSQISEFVQQAARDAGLQDFALYAVETAVDEACSNIIEHAYGGENRGDIHCTCEINDEGLTIILIDHGRPFDPTCVAIPDVHALLDDRPGHGLGLYMMQKWMDEVRFEFNTSMGNRLVMVKRREQKGA